LQISYCTETFWLEAVAEFWKILCFYVSSLFIKMK
jgi:hypothetical protein